MMKTVKTVLLAATLAAFGSSAFAGMMTGEIAEEVVVKGEVLSTSPRNNGFNILVKYRSTLYYCSFGVYSSEPWLSCYFVD